MTNNSEEYNGWSNRETWAAALHIDNDEGSYTYAREIAKEYPNKYQFADALRRWVEDMIEAVYHEPSEACEWARLAAKDIGSLDRVDWQEIADGILDE